MQIRPTPPSNSRLTVLASNEMGRKGANRLGPAIKKTNGVVILLTASTLHRDGEKGGNGVRRSTEVGEEGDYILIATLSPPE